MQTINKEIDVNADIRTVYNQWTQFERFPEFMEGIEEVRQLDDKHLHWVASIAGKREEWDAEIYDQVPDQHVAWRSTSGRPNQGEVSFEKIQDNQTRLRVAIAYDTHGAMEKVGDAVGLVSGRVQGDLRRFKDYVEHRPGATGGWRGEIHGGQVDPESGTGARSKRLRETQGPSQTPPGSNMP